MLKVINILVKAEKMSDRKKVFIWLVVIAAGILYLCFGNPSKTVRLVLCIWGGTILIGWFIKAEIRALELDKMCQSIDRRFRCIEHSIGFLAKTNEDDIEKRLSRPVSYEAYLILIPHWVKIFDEFARRRKHSPEVLKNVFAGEELDFEQRKALWGKDFRFRIFQDETSGMRQIWSDHHKTFVNGITVRGAVFEPSDQLPELTDLNKQYVTHEVPTEIECTPEGLSLEGGFLFESVTLAQIPYRHILKMLLNLGKCDDWGAEYAIKKFPRKLEKDMGDNNVQYDNDPWTHLYGDKLVDEDFDNNPNHLNNEDWFKKEGIELYNQDTNWHAFHTPYFTVSISLKVFGSFRIPYPRNSLFL